VVQIEVNGAIQHKKSASHGIPQYHNHNATSHPDTSDTNKCSVTNGHTAGAQGSEMCSNRRTVKNSALQPNEIGYKSEVWAQKRNWVSKALHLQR
jgi:hypothetical protein